MAEGENEKKNRRHRSEEGIKKNGKTRIDYEKKKKSNPKLTRDAFTLCSVAHVHAMYFACVRAHNAVYIDFAVRSRRVILSPRGRKTLYDGGNNNISHKYKTEIAIEFLYARFIIIIILHLYFFFFSHNFFSPPTRPLHVRALREMRILRKRSRVSVPADDENNNIRITNYRYYNIAIFMRWYQLSAVTGTARLIRSSDERGSYGYNLRSLIFFFWPLKIIFIFE